jgi:hypothetical protein
MGWDDFARRRKAIMAVLDYATAHPSAGLPFDEVADVPNVFANRYELVLALQYKWRQALWSRLELLSLDGARTGFLEAKDLVKRAWDECAKAEPALRRLLDETAGDFGAALRRALSQQDDLITSAAIGHTAKAPGHTSPYVA